MTEGPIAELAARLDEIAADVGEHDKTLMAIIRRGARDGAVPIPDSAETDPEKQLELVDRTVPCRRSSRARRGGCSTRS